jgi:hypothetical protein
MDTWLAYAPVKNNPEDAAKVRFQVPQLTPRWFSYFTWLDFTIDCEALLLRGHNLS